MMNYRLKYRAHLKLPLILELMLLDPNNPRSLVYQVERLKNYLSNLPKKHTGNSMAQYEKFALEAFTKIKLADRDHLGILNVSTERYQHLEIFLGEINALLHNVYHAVSTTYFQHAHIQQQLFR